MPGCCSRNRASLSMNAVPCAEFPPPLFLMSKMIFPTGLPCNMPNAFWPNSVNDGSDAAFSRLLNSASLSRPQQEL